jgi:hypothetical protein
MCLPYRDYPTPRVPECLSFVRIGSPAVPAPLEPRVRQHSLAVEGAVGANSDEWKESLALCLLCGFCCARFCLSAVGQKGRNQLRSVSTLHLVIIGQEKGQLKICLYITLADHWPGKRAAKDMSLHYTC